jgi:hypothetical protein
MKENRRSFLQVKLLLQLVEAPAKTVAELAQRVNSQRPSVSRSLRTLKEQGMVHRNRQGWHITEAGRIEANQAKEKLEETRLMLKDAALHATGEIAVNLTDLLKPGIASIQKQLLEFSKLASVDSSFIQHEYLDKIIDLGKISNPFLSTSFYESAVKPIIEMQERYSDFSQNILSSITSFGTITALNQNSQLLAQTVGELAAIRQDALNQIIAGIPTIDYSWLSKDISQVSQGFIQVFQDHIKEFNAVNIIPITVPKTSEFVLPTSIVASYSTSARGYMDASMITDPYELPLHTRDLDDLGDEDLDPHLSQLNPEYVEMRRGAWLALYQPNPDRLRHAATSQRELVRQLLQQLVPEAQLPEENRKSTQLKARIRIALGTSDGNAEFIDSVGKAVVSLYDQLNKYTHHNVKHEESLRALLHTGEGLIRFVLSLVD